MNCGERYEMALIPERVHEFVNRYGKSEYQIHFKDEAGNKCFTITSSWRIAKKVMSNMHNALEASFLVVAPNMDFNAYRIKELKFV